MSSNSNPYEGLLLFKPYRLLIFVCVKVCQIFLPRTVCKWLWPLTNFAHGHVGSLLRYCLAKKLLKSCGEYVFFGPNITIRNCEQLVLGNYCSIHANCWIEAAGSVELGDYVAVAHNSSLVSTNHSWSDEALPIKKNRILCEPIIIESDVWVSCGVRVLAGVRIGQRSVIGAGAVVTKDVPPNSIAVGIPAKVKRSIDD